MLVMVGCSGSVVGGVVVVMMGCSRGSEVVVMVGM